MSIMVKAGGGSGGNKYTGPNPLTIGADGYSFDPKTLLKDGLTIVNGVEGEDLTATEADMALAIAELQRMVARKISENRGAGQYVWKKLTAEGGELVNYVINDDETAYPDGAEQDGYWYESFKSILTPELFGCTKMDISEMVYSGSFALKNLIINHGLNVLSHLLLIKQSSQD